MKRGPAAAHTSKSIRPKRLPSHSWAHRAPYSARSTWARGSNPLKILKIVRSDPAIVLRPHPVSRQTGPCKVSTPWHKTRATSVHPVSSHLTLEIQVGIKEGKMRIQQRLRFRPWMRQIRIRSLIQGMSIKIKMAVGIYGAQSHKPEALRPALLNANHAAAWNNPFHQGSETRMKGANELADRVGHMYAL